MRKRLLITAFGMLGVGGIVANRIRHMTKEIGPQKDHTIQHAGLPDQLEKRDIAQMENEKMVSEGSQYGVHYYNNWLENHKEKGI